MPIGLVANRIGNRRLIVLSTAGLALSVAATALTQSLLVIALSRFFWGACFGANQVVKSPFMVTLTPSGEHTAQFSWHNLVSMLSVAAGSALGGALPIAMSGALSIAAVGALRPEEMPLAYRASILVAALLLLLSAMPLLLLKRRPDSAQMPRAILGFGRSVPWRRVLRLAFPLFVFGISGGWTFPFFNLIFRDLFGISDSVIGGVIGLGWLFMGLLPLLNPVWEARLGRAGALSALMILSAAAFVGFSFSQALWIAVIFYVMAIGIRNTMQPLFQPLLMASLDAEHHNVASSVGLALWNLGWFVSALTFGWLQAAVGIRAIMLLVAAFVVLNSVAIQITALRQPARYGG